MSELRDKVSDVVFDFMGGCFLGDSYDGVNAIAAILEGTGAPAYMRVAADLRGEVESEN